MNEENPTKKQLPTGLKIAALYLIVAGVISLLWPILGTGSNHPAFQSKSTAYKLGAYSREAIINILFLTSGIGLLLFKSWARKLALIVIVVSTIFSTNSFAWGFARGGTPGLSIYIVSLLIVGIWNSIWFYLIFRKESAAALG